MINIFRQLIVPWLLALLLAWLLVVVWVHSETRNQQQQQIQQLALTVNFALQANLPVNGEPQLANQLRQLHYNSPLAVEQIAAYNGQRQLIASSTSATDAPVLISAPTAYQVSALANGRQLAVLPVSAGLAIDQATFTGQLPDNGYIAVVMTTEFSWLVWLMPLALLTGAMSVGLLLSVGAVKRGQLRQNTDIELLVHNMQRLQALQQECQIAAPLVTPLKPLQHAFNELATHLDQRASATEQLIEQLNQRVQYLNSQSTELNQQRQLLTAGQQLQQHQIQHWLAQSLVLWQRKKHLPPVQQQRLSQMHLLAGHYQFSAVDMTGSPLQLADWLSQHIDELSGLIPSEAIVLDWHEHPDNLAYSVNICSQTLTSLLQALIMLGLRTADVSKISMTMQLQVGCEPHSLLLVARCDGQGLPTHCRQLIQTGDMRDLQWSDADIALLKAVKNAGASFSTQSLDGLGCILELTLPVESERVSTAKLLQHLLVFDTDIDRLQLRSAALIGVAAQVTQCNQLSELKQLIDSSVFELVLLFLPASANSPDWQSIVNYARQHAAVLCFGAPAGLATWQDLIPTVLANHQYCLASIMQQAERMITPTDKQHVLVVDDNETNLAFVQVLLKNKPLILHTATSAAQVFALCKQQRFDLILLDIQLPDMSGVDVARRLRKMPQYQKVPIVRVYCACCPR